MCVKSMVSVYLGLLAFVQITLIRVTDGDRSRVD